MDCCRESTPSPMTAGPGAERLLSHPLVSDSLAHWPCPGMASTAKANPNCRIAADAEALQSSSMLQLPLHIRLISYASIVTFVIASMWVLDTFFINTAPEPQIIEDVD